MGGGPRGAPPPEPVSGLEAPGSTLHWERWEALRQLCLTYKILSMATWSEAIHRLALQVGVDAEAPDHRLEISRAKELLKENAWAPDRAAGTAGGGRGLAQQKGTLSARRRIKEVWLWQWRTLPPR